MQGAGMSTLRRANRRCAGSRRGGHGRGRDFACGAPVRCARECAGETDAQPLGVQPVKLRTQRWAQLLAFMLALVCSASLVLHGSQRLQADHLDLAGPSGRSAIRVDIAATAQCLASNKLLRPSPMDAIGPMGMDYMLVVHNPVVPAVQNGAFVVVQQCDSGASTADNVVLSAEQWRALNALAVHRIDNWHIGGTNAAAVRPIQFVPAAAAAATAAAAIDAGVADVAVNSDLDACAGVPAGEAMPDLLGVSAGCGLVGCRKPGSLMTLRYTHNPARGWDFLADPVLVGVTACEVKGDTGQGQLCVRGGNYGEASRDVHTLIHVAAQRLATKHWRLLGARSQGEVHGFYVAQLRRRMGVTAVREFARHRLRRAAYVGVPRAVVEQMMQQEAMRVRLHGQPAAEPPYADFFAWAGQQPAAARGGGGG